MTDIHICICITESLGCTLKVAIYCRSYALVLSHVSVISYIKLKNKNNKLLTSGLVQQTKHPSPASFSTFVSEITSGLGK